MNETIIGIDPGKAGGLAFIKNEKWGPVVQAIPMPVNGKEIDLQVIRSFLVDNRPDLIVIEKVHAMPGQGVVSMFTFGAGYGMLQGLCAGLLFPFKLVTPQAWKKQVLAGTQKDKNAAINYVKKAYPMISLLASPRCKQSHDGMADAVCIADYGFSL